MPFVLPSDPAPGNAAPASWGDAVRAGLNYLANPPACRVYNSSGQNVATSATVVLAYNSERFDTDAMHNTVTNNSRITIVTAGLYAVFAIISLSGHATGRRSLSVRLNGTTEIFKAQVQAVTTGPDPTDLNVGGLWKFAAGDYIEAIAGQNSGTTLTATTEFGAAWLGLG